MRSSPSRWSGTPQPSTTSVTTGQPTTIYLRAQASQIAAVDSVLAATANPQNPREVDVSQLRSALVAWADAQENAVHRDHTYAYWASPRTTRPERS